jgi:hypothetical protein
MVNGLITLIIKKENKMPTLLTIDKFKVGMKLAVPIKNKLGQLLLPAETNLEEKHRRIMSTWGITAIYVLDDENIDPEIAIDSQLYSILKEKLKNRMQWISRNAIEEDLIEMALKKMLENSK